MAKLRQMYMGRDYTLRTTKGHTLRFEKMKPRPVPKAVEDEAMRFGAIPKDVDEMVDEQSRQQDADNEKGSGEPRELQLRNAIEQMIEDNIRDEWSASGRPKTEALAKRTGLDGISATERDEVHDQVKSAE